MLKGARSYDEHLIQSLKDPAEASSYLQTALEDGNRQVFLVALRNVAVALGGVRELSKRTKLNRESLYRVLSEKGNPELGTLNSILGALGLEVAIRPKKRQKRVA